MLGPGNYLATALQVIIGEVRSRSLLRGCTQEPAGAVTLTRLLVNTGIMSTLSTVKTYRMLYSNVLTVFILYKSQPAENFYKFQLNQAEVHVMVNDVH